MDAHTRIGATGSGLTEEGIIQQTAQQCVEILSKMKQHGDFAGLGVMTILGMNQEDVIHDSKVRNQALDEAISAIKKQFGEWIC